MTREFENAKHPEHSEGDKGPRNLKMMTMTMSIKATRMVMVPMVVKVMVLILIWVGDGGYRQF